MKKIPLEIENQFLILLNKKIPQKLHSDYLKWLMFYLDFCRKYEFDENNHESLQKFLIKLKQKNQTDVQLKQANNAISFYFELKTDVSPESQKPEFHSWNTIFSQLESEIKLRHYSPRTLEAYSYWVKQFSRFLLNKNPEDVNTHDVKGICMAMVFSSKRTNLCSGNKRTKTISPA